MLGKRIERRKFDFIKICMWLEFSVGEYDLCC